MILNAVQKHSNPNSNDDSPLLVHLKDADMLDVGAIIGFRVGSLRGRYLPIYTPKDFRKNPRSTEENKLTSQIHDLDRCLEWEGMLRTPKGKKLGKWRFTFMRLIRKKLQRELRELNLI